MDRSQPRRLDFNRAFPVTPLLYYMPQTRANPKL
jgi:hypothetical protein